jgi:hypothetical protein
MIVYADKRADFHRHSRTVEIRFIKEKNSLKGTPNVVKRLAARVTLSFLLEEVRNLHFGAQVIELNPMVNKLALMLESLKNEIEANEAAIESLAQRQRRNAADRLQKEAEQLAKKSLGEPARKGVTLLSDLDHPILFTTFSDVTTQDTKHPVYTLWNTDKALSASFTSMPYPFLEWTPIPKGASPASAINSILRTDGFRL